MEKSLVILSGGQDSVTCLYWALQNFGPEVEAITFNYGQNHSVEIEQAVKLCEIENVKHTIIDISFLDTIVKSALTSKGNVNETNEIGLPASFVPNRNQLFITLAHAYAQKIGVKILVAGMCQTDYSGYPDCRDAYLQDLIEVTNVGSGVLHNPIQLFTPLMYLNKAQTFELADKMNVLNFVVEHSHTCYNGVREQLHEWGYGCGTCGACELRAKGFQAFKDGSGLNPAQNV